MNEVVICKQIKCNDYLEDCGEPAWCCWACFPVKKVVNKCPKILSKQEGKNKDRHGTDRGAGNRIPAKT
jgi:hypothetical protein